nr:hypothetical protein [Tanacetum cinerariifolium]
MAEYSQKWHNGTSRTRSTETSNGLAAIQAQLNNLGREIKKVNEKVDAAQHKFMPLSTYLNLGLGELAHTKLTVELADKTVKYPKGIAKNVLVVLEDMDAYHDDGMDDVIFGEPFLREVGINAKWFEGMITIHNGNEEVTYQMARSHSRFKHHTNEQCNKIPPLLNVSEEDKMNGILHLYQKL